MLIVVDSLFSSFIASIARTSRSFPDDPLDPLVESDAPHSSTEMDELRALATSILPTWSGCLLPLSATGADRPFWQFGLDGHTNDVLEIIGSITLNAVTNDGAVASPTSCSMELANG